MLRTPSNEFWIANRWGSIFYYFYLHSIAIVFLLIGLFNLLNYKLVGFGAVLASLAWFLLIGWLCWGSIKERGIRRFFIDQLWCYADHDYIRAEPEAFHIGFRFFEKPVDCDLIRPKQIISIHWSPGQATAMAMREMNDWNLFIRYLPDNHQRKVTRSDPPWELHVIELDVSQEEADAIGKAFIEFLQSHGLGLIPGENAREYTTQPSCKLEEQADHQV
ncbi:Hypothetical protein PBC10988_40850 [Planctomycetales bacterium 10988]|nr:Hypothetical protein PBC10988_40850 [Planctomycetales bacterium 10988]